MHAAFPGIDKHGYINLQQSGEAIRPKRLDLLWPQLPKLPDLTVLDFEGLCLDEDRLVYWDVLRHLGGITHLQRLNLRCFWASDEYFQQLVPLFAGMRDLKQLDLSNTRIHIQSVPDS